MRRLLLVIALVLGPTVAHADLDRNVIRRVIKANIAAIKTCYEKELVANAKAQGSITMRFLIAASGKTSSVTTERANGVSKPMGTCLVTVFEGMQFAKTPRGEAITVAYPLSFRPAP